MRPLGRSPGGCRTRCIRECSRCCPSRIASATTASHSRGATKSPPTWLALDSISTVPAGSHHGFGDVTVRCFDMTGDSLSLCRLGRIRRVRRFPALICPQREPWRGRLQPLTIRSTPSNPFRRVGSDVAGERIVRARSMCMAISCMPGIPAAAVCPSSKTSTTRRSKCSLRRMACCGRRQRWAGSPGEIRL